MREGSQEGLSMETSPVRKTGANRGGAAIWWLSCVADALHMWPHSSGEPQRQVTSGTLANESPSQGEEPANGRTLSQLLCIRTDSADKAAAGSLVVAAKPCYLLSFHPLPQQGPSDPAICVVKSCVPSPQKGTVVTKRWCPLSTKEFWLLGSGTALELAVEAVLSKP